MMPDTAHNLLLMVEHNPVPLAFVRNEDRIFLASPVKGSRWPSYVLRNGRAEVYAEGETVKCSARLVSDSSRKEQIMEMFVAKYGRNDVSRWYGEHYRIIQLDPDDGESSENYRDIYYGWLEAEFDGIADDYDNHIYGNPVNSLLRERSVRLLKRTFNRRERLLEVGCGTGTETIEMLREGHEVVASDISMNMLDALDRKAREEGLKENLTLVKINAENIGILAREYGENSFGGIYSTFGAMNCIHRINAVPPGFNDLLRQDGRVVLGIYNRYCISEILGYLMTMQPGKAASRLRPLSPEGESRFCIDVYSYTYMEIRKIFSRYFRTEFLEGVPVIIPPSNLSSYLQRFSRRLDLLKLIDSRIGAMWPFSLLGDHFLTVMRKSTP